MGQLSKTSSANLKLQVSLYEHDWFMEAAFFLALHTGIRTRVPTLKLLQTVFLDAGSFIVMTYPRETRAFFFLSFFLSSPRTCPSRTAPAPCTTPPNVVSGPLCETAFAP